MKRLFFILFGSLAATVAFSQNIYLAQTAAGSNTGADCANAHPVGFFNTGSNWGTGAGQIGPGTTVHLCGTFTGTAGSTMLTFQGSGASGNPITLRFETGAVLTAPYWSTSTGAINLSGKSFITVDGGTNGLITCTDNGTGKGHQVDTIGLSTTSGYPTNVTIQNLTISNLYLRTVGDTGTTGFNSAGMQLQSGGNLRVCNNTINDVKTGIGIIWNSNISADVICNNTVYNRDAGIVYAAAGGTSTGAQIYGNSIGGAVNWDTPSDSFHHDGVHVWATNGTSGLMIFNNYFYGDVGAFSTAQIFLEDTQQSPTIFNNVFTTSNNSAATNASVTVKGALNAHIFNNTFFSTTGQAIQFENAASGGVVENNVITGYGLALFIADTGSATSFTANNNVYYNSAGMNFCWASNCNYLTYSQWRSACKCDSTSSTANPNLSSDGHLAQGSALAGMGVNLTTQNITALNLDKAGISRPGGTTGWDPGAYQVSALATFSPPPSSLAGVPVVAGSGATSCDVNADGSTDVVDVQLITNMELGVASCTANIGGSLACSDPARQTVIKAALGAGCKFVSLQWAASSAPGVVGYNVYRGTSPGGESTVPVNTGGPVSSTSFADLSAAPGILYSYYVTASNGTSETGPSNEISVSAP